jgi:SAM-dependent methyltransferase
MNLSALSIAQSAISCLYHELLGREPDREGLDFWANAVLGGLSVSEVADELKRAVPGRDASKDRRTRIAREPNVFTIRPPMTMFREPQSGPCKICGAPTALFDVVDFFKFCETGDYYHFGLSGIPVYYNRCETCGFISTQAFDHWSPQDFARFIYNEEYIRVDGDYVEARPKQMSKIVSDLFGSFKDRPLLDYGAGNGLTARLLEDAGFSDVAGYDPFSLPEKPSRKSKLITCFEVMEHSPDPRRSMLEISNFLTNDGVVLLSTAVQPQDIQEIGGAWWYIAPRNGHVSMFSRRSLQNLASDFGLECFVGVDFHLFATHGSAKTPLIQQVIEKIGANPS